MSKEFYDAQEHQLNKRLLGLVRHTIAEWAAMNPGPETDNLMRYLDQAGLRIPVLYCQGLTKYGDSCGKRLHHLGECSWT